MEVCIPKQQDLASPMSPRHDTLPKSEGNRVVHMCTYIHTHVHTRVRAHAHNHTHAYGNRSVSNKDPG